MSIYVTIFVMLLYGTIFISGLLNAINPRLIWEKFESHNATKEPTRLYFLGRRVSGIVAMLIITALVLVPYSASIGYL